MPHFQRLRLVLCFPVIYYTQRLGCSKPSMNASQTSKTVQKGILLIPTRYVTHPTFPLNHSQKDCESNICFPLQLSNAGSHQDSGFLPMPEPQTPVYQQVLQRQRALEDWLWLLSPWHHHWLLPSVPSNAVSTGSSLPPPPFSPVHSNQIIFKGFLSFSNTIPSNRDTI